MRNALTYAARVAGESAFKAADFGLGQSRRPQGPMSQSRQLRRRLPRLSAFMDVAENDVLAYLGFFADHLREAPLDQWPRTPRLRGQIKRRRVRPKTWTSALRKAVERMRQDFPMWGRDKLGPILRAEGLAVSNAAVGRIITDLVARGVVEAVPCENVPTPAVGPAKRCFARRAKWTVGNAFNRATAMAAASFLDKILDDMLFPVKAIQVDVGSEFMAEFVTACQKRGVALYVLPPRSPLDEVRPQRTFVDLQFERSPARTRSRRDRRSSLLRVWPTEEACVRHSARRRPGGFAGRARRGQRRFDAPDDAP